MDKRDTLKKQTLRVFDIGKTLISDLKMKISEYANTNGVGDEAFMQGYTFNSGLDFLNQVEKVIYNDENKQILQSAPEESDELQNVFKRIDQNNKHLFEIEASLNVFFKNLN